MDIFKMRFMKCSCLSILGLFLLMGVLAGAAARPVDPAKPATTAAATHPVDEEPWCARVLHSPQQPKSGQSVTMSASIAAGYTDVALQYQVVEPGNYIELHDGQYAKDWT